METHIVPGRIMYDNLLYDSLGLPRRFSLFSKVVCAFLLIENEQQKLTAVFVCFMP